MRKLLIFTSLLCLLACNNQHRAKGVDISDEDKIKQVVDMAKEKNIPIRIGVNSGSLEKELVEKYGGVTPQGLVESALKHVHILEKYEFYDIVVIVERVFVNSRNAFWNYYFRQ